MAKKRRRTASKKTVSKEFKTKVQWEKHKLRPGTQRYNRMIKNRFGLGKNEFYESMSDIEKQSRRDLERRSDTTAKNYTDFSRRQAAYRRAVNELYQNPEFKEASQEERVQMMASIEPDLQSAMTADKKSFDLSMSLLAYEDRENLINTGEFANIKAKQYRDNYLSAISNSGMPVNDTLKQALRDVPDEDLLYFIDELLPALPDWYGMQGSTLQPAVTFIGNLQKAVEFYKSQKDNK